MDIKQFLIGHFNKNETSSLWQKEDLNILLMSDGYNFLKEEDQLS